MSKSLFFTAKHEDAPSDAIRLTKSQVVKFYNKLVYDWQPASDVYVYQYELVETIVSFIRCILIFAENGLITAVVYLPS